MITLKDPKLNVFFKVIELFLSPYLRKIHYFFKIKFLTCSAVSFLAKNIRTGLKDLFKVKFK